MQFKIVHTFNWPADTIIDILSTGEDLTPPEKLSNVSARKVIELKREGKNFYRRTEWCVHGQIPKVAQKVVSAEMLTFIEESTWDGTDGIFKTRIIPHFLKGTLTCTSTSKWFAAGPAATRREYAGVVEIRLPIIGGLLEKTIVDYLKKNTEENAAMVAEALALRLGAPGNA